MSALQLGQSAKSRARTRAGKRASTPEVHFDRRVRKPFVVVALVVGIFCVAAWTELVPREYERLSFILSGLAGLIGVAALWFYVGPYVSKVIAEDTTFPEAGVGRMHPGEGEWNDVEHWGGDDHKQTLALTDPLTGLGNRSRMLEKFNRLKSTRDDGQPLTLGLLNIDGMKPVNDLYGTIGGDEILRQCAQRLAAAVEGDGFVCRFAGDVFGFIFPSVTDERKAEEKGRLLQNVLMAPFNIDGRTVRLTGSFGMAIHCPRTGDFEHAVSKVETALHHSKRRGRGRVTLHSKEIDHLVDEGARMEKALREAIASHDVRPHFQPIISLQDGRLLGFEALARWTDPELGEVSPSKFIAIAEERGLIISLTESLLIQAASAAAAWPDDLFLSFNLSSLQLVDFATAEQVKNAARDAGLPPNRLEIEVTETALVSDPETAARIIDDLHKAGIRVSMDDFGTGQSSLGRLRQLKLDKVKIDRSFISTLGEDKTAEHIVRAILEMCAGLGMTVVAEGIEQIEQAEMLRRFGCHAGQGFLFGKPQDRHHTISYIRDFKERSGPAEGARVA